MAKLNSKNQIRFNSICELGEHVENLMETKNIRLFGNSSTDRYSDTGGLDLGEAVAMAKNGGHWQEGADLMPRVHVAHERLNGQPILAPSLVNNVQGFACNVPNYLNGLPDAMMDFQDDLQGEKLIKVAVHVGRVWSADQSQIMNRGAAIMAVLDQLSREGYSIELTALWRNTGAGGKHTASVETVIKHGCDHWAPESVAFALCHAAFQRRLCWRVVESMHDSAAKITNQNYGNGRDAKYAEFDINFGYMSYPEDYNSIEKATDNIKAQAIEQLANNERLAA